MATENDCPNEEGGQEDFRKIFVGGLQSEVTDNDLQEYFSKFGNVKSCTIKMDAMTGNSRGFGFVVFSDDESLQAALAEKNHELKGKKFEPRMAKPVREPQKKVFVGGLDTELPEEQIRAYFENFGQIESLDFVSDKTTNKRKNFFFVTYSTEAQAKAAAKVTKQEVEGKSCNVKLALPQGQGFGRGGGRGGWMMGYGGYSGGYGGGYYGGGYGYDGYGSYGGWYDPYAAYNPYAASGGYGGFSNGFGGRGTGGKFRGGRGKSASRGSRPYPARGGSTGRGEADQNNSN